MIAWELSKIDDFYKYSDDWNGLNKKHTQTPLLEFRFIKNLVDTFSSGNEIIAVCKNNNEIVAAGIFTKVNSYSYQTFQPSQAPIGAWIANPEINIEQLLGSLKNKLPGIILVLGITQQDPDACPRPQNKNKIKTLDYIQTARISLSDTFEEYWSARGKNLRHDIRRQKNKLDREKINTKLEIITAPEDINGAIKNYGELESSGWKSKHGTAINIDNEQGKFYLNLFRDYCQTGNGFIYKYYYDNKLTAMDLCITGFKTFIILKTTYDENQKKSSPANLMRFDYLPELFNSTIEKLEFYGKVMPWHTKWSNEIRIMFHINYYPFRIIKWLK